MLKTQESIHRLAENIHQDLSLLKRSGAEGDNGVMSAAASCLEDIALSARVLAADLKYQKPE